MSSLVLSIPSAPAAAGAASGAPSAPPARDAQSPNDAQGFAAALARSRENRSRQTEDKTEPASDAPPARRRGPGATPQREETSPADLLAMAMLTPAFHAQAALQQQQQRAAAQGAEPGADAALQGASTADNVPGGAEAHPRTQPGTTADTAADTAATQAAQANSAELQDKDEKSAKAKADTLPLPDARTPAAAMAPAAAAAQVQDAAAASKPANAAAPASSKSTADMAAVPLRAAREAAPAEHDIDTASDSPAPLPGAFGFKAALAEATQSPAQAQPVPRLAVPTPVGSEGWGADIGTQMIRMGAGGHHVAELSLNPAGLGPLKVTLTLGDNQAQAAFVSAHESVRRALEAALPQLRETLAGQGIQLGQASVDAGTQQQQQAYGNQEQLRDFEASARSAHGGLRQAGSIDTVDAIDAQPALAGTRGRAAGAIDTFA
ncbi:MAG: flagellar hook-length control protein FliK [Proteobacteria bacterium]|nr:flagellar hook-length control protein FliK [Pseudomonadota bacterium]